MIKIIFLLTIVCFSQSGFAQSKSDKKTTVLSFEDELIQGDVSSPDLFVILKNKNINFGRLLKLRQDFIPEMRQTRQDVHGSSD
jgi:hypothetical protein